MRFIKSDMIPEGKAYMYDMTKVLYHTISCIDETEDGRGYVVREKSYLWLKK